MVEKFLADRECFFNSGREVFWSVDREKSEKLDEKFLWAAGFSRQNVSRGINMASNSAGNVLREILGRIDELSAAIEQSGSSLSSATTSRSTSSVENEVRNAFGALHQAPSSTASASSRVFQDMRTSGCTYLCQSNIYCQSNKQKSSFSKNGVFHCETRNMVSE